MTADRAGAGPLEGAASAAAAPSWPDPATYDAVVRQSLDAVILTDNERLVRVWNPAAERLYGIPATTAIGEPMATIVASFELDGAPLDAAVARSSLEATGAWRRRVVHRPMVGPMAGHEVVVDAVVTLLRAADGGPIGTLAVNRDVTDSARLESEMAALGSLVAATDRARTKAEVAQAALDILCRATGADAGLVTSMNGTYEALAHVGAAQATIDVIVNFGQLGGPIAQALEPADAWVSADVATAPLREDVRAAVLEDGIRHLIVVGLRLSGRLTGILALAWRHESPREPSRAIMAQAAALIASSIENARLLAAVESGLDEERLLTRRMRALVELTRLPESGSTGSSGDEQLIAEVDAIIGADGSALARVEGDRLVLVAVKGVAESWMQPLVNRPIAEMPIPSRLLAGSPPILARLGVPTVSASGYGSSVAEGYQAIAAFPIRAEGRLIGLLFSIFKRPIDELEIDERSLDAIGRVLDISFTNRRLREVVGASERRYRELFAYAPDALLVQSLDDIVLDANPAAHRLYGEGVIGSRVEDLGVTAPLAAPTGDPADAPIVRSSSGIGRRLDGTTFPEEVELRMIEIDGERRVMAIVRDLTERTKLQAELIQAQKMEAIGLLVAGVAHELNNPLAAIIAFSQLIRTDPDLPVDLRSQADSLVQEANRTRVIVQNLLDFARQRPPERVATELRPLVDSVLGLQSYVLHRNQVTVEVDIPADLPAILVDRSQLQQVLINLTVNSAQAIRDGGRPGTIRIEARPASNDKGPTVRISIVDDGPGLPSEILSRLFMPFVTTKEPGAGTGLGLSVSFGIIAGHGGTLRHEPNPAGGASFVIELPVGRDQQGPAIAPALAPAPAATALPAPAAPIAPADAPMRPEPTAPAPIESTRPADAAQAGRSSRPARVLVLDDEPSIRDFLGRVLVRAGYEPVIAATGAEALEAIRRDPPDAILCDHRMAGMSGTEFHDAVSAIAPVLGRRFAFMSGDVLNPELHDFAVARGVQLLAKPFDIATVGSIVATLLTAEPA